jgi:hypothetical protein
MYVRGVCVTACAWGGGACFHLVRMGTLLSHGILGGMHRSSSGPAGCCCTPNNARVCGFFLLWTYRACQPFSQALQHHHM